VLPPLPAVPAPPLPAVPAPPLPALPPALLVLAAPPLPPEPALPVDDEELLVGVELLVAEVPPLPPLPALVEEVAAAVGVPELESSLLQAPVTSAADESRMMEPYFMMSPFYLTEPAVPRLRKEA
jgi:hypothetical protein